MNMNTSLPIDKPLRLEQAAEQLAVSVKTVRRLIRDCSISAFKIRGRWFLRDSDLKTYEEKQRACQKGKQP
jgi:excisionase family DNA binding protein